MVTRKCSKNWIISQRLPIDLKVPFSKPLKLATTILIGKRQRPEACRFKSTLYKLMTGQRVSKVDLVPMELLQHPTPSDTSRTLSKVSRQMRTWNSLKLHPRASQSIQQGNRDQDHDQTFLKAQASWVTPNTSLETRLCQPATASLSSQVC